MASPRARLRAAMGECLSRIRRADGFATDAGQAFTLEPGQVDADASAVLTVLITKQQRATQPALVRTHRLTTAAVVIKLPSAPGAEQTELDDAISDVEAAIDGQQSRFPQGFDFPQYVSMEPVPPEPGSGWVGAVVTYQSHIPIQ